MIHFPDKAIWGALDHFRRSSIRYLLAPSPFQRSQTPDISYLPSFRYEEYETGLIGRWPVK
jgi:hypothetical protein